MTDEPTSEATVQVLIDDDELDKAVVVKANLGEAEQEQSNLSRRYLMKGYLERTSSAALDDWGARIQQKGESDG